ncbi:MAG: hypothetical protein IPI34_12455 [bacterium]|nr:hypothetical protein [bacterium]
MMRSTTDGPLGGGIAPEHLGVDAEQVGAGDLLDHRVVGPVVVAPVQGGVAQGRVRRVVHAQVAGRHPQPQVRGGVPGVVAADIPGQGAAGPRRDAGARVAAEGRAGQDPGRPVVGRGLQADEAGVAVGVGQVVGHLDDAAAVGALGRRHVADHGVGGLRRDGEQGGDERHEHGVELHGSSTTLRAGASRPSTVRRTR